MAQIPKGRSVKGPYKPNMIKYVGTVPSTFQLLYIFSHSPHHLNPLRLRAARGRRRDWLNTSCLEKDAMQSELWDVRLQLSFFCFKSEVHITLTIQQH